MADRQEIRVGEPVRVKPDGCAAIRTKVRPRIVRRQTAMTERNGVVLRDLLRDLDAPRVRPKRCVEQPTDEHPHSEAQHDGDAKNADCKALYQDARVQTGTTERIARSPKPAKTGKAAVKRAAN